MVRWLLLVVIVVLGAACGGKTGGPVVTPPPTDRGGAALLAAPMQGPYPDLAAFCAVAAAIEETDEFWIEARQGEVEHTCAPAEVPVTAVSTPYRGTAIISAGWQGAEGASHERLFLAIQTEAGWFYAQVGDLARDGGTTDRNLAIAATRVEQRDIGGALPVIVTEVRASSEGCNRIDDCVSDEEREGTICGVGPSGTPSCLAPLLLSAITNWTPYPEDDDEDDEDDDDDEDGDEDGDDGAGAPPAAERHERRTATLTYPGGGAIELGGDLADAKLAGRHLLQFP